MRLAVRSVTGAQITGVDAASDVMTFAESEEWRNSFSTFITVDLIGGATGVANKAVQSGWRKSSTATKNFVERHSLSDRQIQGAHSTIAGNLLTSPL